MSSARERLKADLREAEKELQELDKRLDHRPDLGLGEGGTGAYLWEMALARKERVITRIEALQEAVSRVREGTYGRCDRCGAQIDSERLEILPATSVCADCARAASGEATSAPGTQAKAAARKR